MDGCYIHYPTRFDPMLFDSKLAAIYGLPLIITRRIAFPDVDGCVAAVWTPAAECLLQRCMRDHGFAVA